eukprot:GHVU01233240.1.p1 GENE.GHVU01233240.1~~GHVU01233240.1.p1  ORF type:complete len:218 (+),score=49.15 GHVU01233240.1:74-727(+)
MTELFRSYEDDLQSNLETIETLLQNIHEKKSSYENVDHMIRECQRAVISSERCLRQLDMERRSLNPSHSESLKSRLDDKRRQLESFSLRLREMKEEAGRRELFGADGVGGAAARSGLSAAAQSSQQQQHQPAMMTGTEKMSEGAQRVEESCRLALETEGVALEVLRELHGQREVIGRAKTNLVESDYNLEGVRGAVNRMVELGGGMLRSLWQLRGCW